MKIVKNKIKIFWSIFLSKAYFLKNAKSELLYRTYTWSSLFLWRKLCSASGTGPGLQDFEHIAVQGAKIMLKLRKVHSSWHLLSHFQSSLFLSLKERVRGEWETMESLLFAAKPYPKLPICNLSSFPPPNPLLSLRPPPPRLPTLRHVAAADATSSALIHDCGATAVVLVGAYSLVRAFDFLTEQNLIEQVLSPFLPFCR